MNIDAIKELPALRLENVLRRFKIPWMVFAIFIAVLVFIASTKPSLELGVDKLIEYSVHDGVITVYILLMWPISKALLTKSLNSLAALVEEDPTVTAPPSSANEWRIPVLFGLLMAALDISDTENFLSLSPWLFFISSFMVYAVIAWVVYAVFISARLVTHFVSTISKVRIFDVSPYRPVANWCLSISAMIMLGLSISVLMLGGDFLEIQNLVVYILTAIMGVVVFFAGMWSTHALMAKQKEQELLRVNDELQALHEEVLGKMKNRELEGAQSLLQASETLTAHKGRIEKLPEWPYTMGDIYGLASSFLLPLVFDLINKLF